jgi:hypothetical protein
VLAGESPRRFPLAVWRSTTTESSSRRTFTVRDDETAVLAVIFEQRARRDK